MYKPKTKPFKHQEIALDKSWLKKNFAYFMEMGCLSGDVEVLTNRGFVRFDEIDIEKWPKPLLVLQAIKDEGKLDTWYTQFTEPEAFIKKPIKKGELHAFQFPSTKKGQCNGVFGATLDHVFPFIGDAFNEDITAKEIIKKEILDAEYRGDEKKKGVPIIAPFCSNMHLPSDSKYAVCPDKELAALTPDEIKFMVAVIADGTYPNKNDNKVDFYFTKRRKFLRIQQLAAKAGIRVACETKVRKIKIGEPSIIYVVHAIAPARYKEFTSEWYLLSREQIKAVAEEVMYWDGTITFRQHDNYMQSSKKCSFFTRSQISADFIQFAFFIMSINARKTVVYRKDGSADIQVSVNNSDYDESQIAFPKLNNRSLVDLTKNVTDDINPYRSPVLARIHAGGARIRTKMVYCYTLEKGFKFYDDQEYAYCFRVPSHYFVVRVDGVIFITGNSGKTKVMIDNIGMLYDKKAITGALILAPKGVYQNWSQKEIPTHLSDDIPREMIVWNAAASEKRKKKMMTAIQNWDGSCLQIMVFNIESLITEKGKALINAFIKRHSGKVLALVDESTCIKNHKAKRTKEAIKIGQQCVARRIATGSPVTNSPLDLYAQCAFLDKSLLGHGSYYSFRNHFANVERVMNRQGQSYDKILNYKNLDELSEKIGKFSYRVTKKECLDLPDKIYQTRYIELTPEQKKIYNEMAESAFTFLVDEKGNFKEMSSRVVLTKLLRLHQVLCGIFTADDGTMQRLPNHRLEELKNILDETQGKVIIWAAYIPNIEDIAAMLEKEYGKDSFVTYYGNTSQDDRNSAILKFQDEESPVRFFLGNVQTAGRGITLTAASTVVYYANNFSLEFRQQSEDRAHRYGQKNNVTYIDLMVPGSMDEKIIKALISKKDIAEEVMKDKPSDWITLKRGDEA